MQKLVIIDNYDSFTYNLVQLAASLPNKPEIVVFRNDMVDSDKIRSLSPSHIIISPGPCGPDQAGNSCAIIRELAGQIPILGVCLGHQCIARVLGGQIVRAEKCMHGKVSKIRHDGAGVFTGLPQEFVAMRYHSLVVACGDKLADTNSNDRNYQSNAKNYRNTKTGQDHENGNRGGRLRSGGNFTVSAWTADGVIMAIRNEALMLEGVQFHPESFGTDCGRIILENFLQFCAQPV